MKLATTTADFVRFTSTQTDAMAHIRAAGFRYGDYNFHTDRARRNGIYGENCAAYFDAVNEAQAALGLTLVQAHAPMGAPLDDKDGSFLADTLRCVDACGAWGIKNLVVHSGYLRGLSREETLERNKAFFLPLLSRAEKYGVNILCENFNKMCIDGLYWIDNATDLLAMVECVDHPLFHAIWDVGHANMQDMPQNEEIKRLGAHLRALHIQDNMGEEDNHLCPFLGTLNLDDVMHGLLDIGYNGYFTFEVGRFFNFGDKRRPFAPDERLLDPPFELRAAFEKYLFTLGKTVLEKYGCFEK